MSAANTLAALVLLSAPGQIAVRELDQGPPVPGEALLLEAGAGALLLESGYKLLVESGTARAISALGAAAPLSGAEQLVLVQPGPTSTRRIELDDLVAWLVGQVS